MAVETAKEAKSQDGDNRTMGRKTYIPFKIERVKDAEGPARLFKDYDVSILKDDCPKGVEIKEML